MNRDDFKQLQNLSVVVLENNDDMSEQDCESHWAHTKWQIRENLAKALNIYMGIYPLNPSEYIKSLRNDWDGIVKMMNWQIRKELTNVLSSTLPQECEHDIKERATELLGLYDQGEHIKLFDELDKRSQYYGYLHPHKPIPLDKWKFEAKRHMHGQESSGDTAVDQAFDDILNAL